MKDRTHYPEVWGIGLGLFLALYSWGLTRALPQSLPPTLDFDSPYLALETMETPADLIKLLGGDPEEFSESIFYIRNALYFDFGFIFAYVAFLAYTGHYAGRKIRKIYHRNLALLLVFLAIAGGADAIENYFLLQVTDLQTLESNDWVYEFIRPTSQLKWFALFWTGAWISFFFWLYENGIFLKLAGILYFVAFLVFMISFYQIHFLEKSLYVFVLACGIVWLQFFLSFVLRSFSKNT